MNTIPHIPQQAIDTAFSHLYNEAEVRQIADAAAIKAAAAAAEQAVAQILGQMSGTAILDNEKSSLVEKPCKEDSNMASNFQKSYVYLDTDGAQKSKRFYGNNEKETDLKYQAFLKDLYLQPPKTAPLFRDFVEQTYRPTFIESLSPTTIENYNRYLRLYIYPFLGDKHMDEITVVDIQSWYNHLAEGSKYGYKNDINKDTITRVSGFTSRIFTVAVEMDVISSTPIKPRLLKNNGRPATHHKALPDEEVTRIKLAIPLLEDERQRLYMALFAYTNLRREEVLGLKWEDLDLENKIGHVVRAVTYPNNRFPVIGRTKTESSTGIFIIPEPLKEILSAAGSRQGFVLSGKNADQPLPYSTMQRIYREAYIKLGIVGKCNNHDWRTTFATQLIEAGATSKQAADQLRHTSTRMVETVYANARDAGILKQRELIERLNAPFSGS